MEVDGEAEYTISAMLLEPLDRDPPQSNYCCESCGHEWVDDEDADATAHSADSVECPECDSKEVTATELEYDSWADSNGAYLICEVFPVDDADPSAPEYDSLEACFGADELRLAREGL